MPVRSEAALRSPVRVRTRLPWVAVTALSLIIAAVSTRYFLFNPNLVPPLFRSRLAAHDGWLLMHIGCGIIALAVGPFQFPAVFRNRHFTLHRWLGRAYLAAVLAGSIAGFRVAMNALGGPVSHAGFGLLAVLWFSTGAMAYIRARQLRFRSHREWMIRNFSLTFAAVTLRLWLPLLVGAFGIEFVTRYVTVSWLCWVPNVLVAEGLVRRGRNGPLIIARSA